MESSETNLKKTVWIIIDWSPGDRRPAAGNPSLLIIGYGYMSLYDRISKISKSTNFIIHYWNRTTVLEERCKWSRFYNSIRKYFQIESFYAMDKNLGL